MTGGLLLFMLTLLLAIIYGLNKKDLKTSKRTLIIIPAVITLLTLFFQLQEYPGAGVLGLSNIISVIAYIIILTTDYKNYKNELGFLTIIATAGTIEVMRRIEWLLN